jgi:acyl carrier protein
MGLRYGPAQQGMVSVTRGENQLLAQLRLPKSVEKAQGDFSLHPSLLDSAIQASICLVADSNPESKYPFLPFALASFTILSSCVKDMYAWVRYAQNNLRDGNFPNLDIDLCDQSGSVCVQLRGLTLQQVMSNESLHVPNEIAVPEKSFLPTTSVTNKPQTIQLNGSQEISTIAVVAKPQKIQLADVHEVGASFVDTFASKPKTIALQSSEDGATVEKTITKQLSGTQHVVAVTNGTPGNVSLSTVDVSLQSSTLSIPAKAQESGHSKVQLQEYLRTSLAEALYLNASEIDVDKSFVDLGLDSIIGVEWVKVINRKLTLEISATKVYDYATIRSFASFLFKELENATGSSKQVPANRISLTLSESSVTVN